MRRVVTPERMDDPDVPPDELARSLVYLRRLNRFLGGWSALLRHLERWSHAWPRAGKGSDGPITILDVGTGSADALVAACRWATRRGHDVRGTGVDLHPGTLACARAFVASRRDVGGGDRIELVEGDARAIVERFGVGSFDYVHAGLFLHHLQEIDILTVLRAMDRVARRGIVWNDLRRSRASLVLLEPLLLGQAEIVRHDARVSVRAGFTRAEVLDAAARVGLDYATYAVEWPFRYRFTLAGERPGAWKER